MIPDPCAAGHDACEGCARCRRCGYGKCTAAWLDELPPEQRNERIYVRYGPNERGWALRCGANRARIDNIPLSACGLNYGDVVELEPPDPIDATPEARLRCPPGATTIYRVGRVLSMRYLTRTVIHFGPVTRTAWIRVELAFKDRRIATELAPHCRGHVTLAYNGPLDVVALNREIAPIRIEVEQTETRTPIVGD